MICRCLVFIGSHHLFESVVFSFEHDASFTFGHVLGSSRGKLVLTYIPFKIITWVKFTVEGDRLVLVQLVWSWVVFHTWITISDWSSWLDDLSVLQSQWQFNLRFLLEPLLVQVLLVLLEFLSWVISYTLLGREAIHRWFYLLFGSVDLYITLV